MQSTTNYQLVKQELTDKADITQISGNWDKIDTEMKRLSDEKFDETGGTISGAVTISAGGIDVTGGADIAGGIDADSLALTGDATVNGTVSVKNSITIDDLSVSKKVDNSEIRINGGNGLEHGASLIAYGKSSSINSGGFLLQAHNGTTGATLTGNADGGLIWSGKFVSNGGLDVTGNATFNSPIIGKTSFLSVVDVTKGTNPSEQKSWHWGFYDKNGFGIPSNRLARIQYTLLTDGTAQMAYYVNKPTEGASEDPVGIIAQWLSGSTARISVTHHPSNDSNDKSLATTYWVRNLKATASQFGLVKLADETALLSEADDATLTVDKAYALNDFRRMNTAYAVGDKVNCAFKFEYFLECTQAGTTSGTTLDTRNVTFGQKITDGTCKWIVRAHIKSVNNAIPDANGNISISIPTPTIASEAEAEAGTNNTKFMTPLRVKQAINYAKPLVNTDANTIKTTGLYYCYTTGSTLISNLNFPINAWGKLIVTGTKNYIIQEYVPDFTLPKSTPLSYKRSFNKSNATDEYTSVGNWSEWRSSGIDTIVGIYSYNTDNSYAVCRLLESGIMYIGGTGMFPKGSNSVTINLPYPCAKNQEPIIVVTPTWDSPIDIPKLSRGGLSSGTNTSQFVVNREGTTSNTLFTWFGFANWK